jgi:hypothetical protein
MPDAVVPGTCESLPVAPVVPVTRTAAGAPLTDAEVTELTRAVTGFWKRTSYFSWILDTSHGVDASTGKRDWLVWWTDVEVVRSGDQVTFRHVDGGSPDNIMIPTTRVLLQAAAGMMLTGDQTMTRLVEQYAKGVSSTMLGMVWDKDDPGRALMARAVIPDDDEVTLSGGRAKRYDYSAWRMPTEAWNTHTIRVEHNPFWGDIWVKNIRSKDDVPHIYLAASILPYVACGDTAASAAAEEALLYLGGFARDIVDSGYWIRSKDETGSVFLPPGDLANFVTWDALVKNAECDAKLATSLLGYHEARGNDCGWGFGGLYARGATRTHYYNYAIVKNFHLAALMHASIDRQDAAAAKLMEGLVTRVEEDFDLVDQELPVDRGRWEADLAVYLLQASGAGLPLTGREARLVMRDYLVAIDELSAWTHWDPWDPALADGVYPHRPGARIAVEDMGYFLWHCWSPFRDESVKLVDCDVIRDPARW